jgi:hypothetical protein
MNNLLENLVQEANNINFTSLEKFAKWYDQHGNPLLCSNSLSRLYITDDAVAITLFQWKNYQVELYILYAPEKAPMHSHPGIQVIQKPYSFKQTKWLAPVSRLIFPQEHGAIGSGGESFNLMLVYEKWHPSLKMTTAGAVWKGKTVGPIQENLIRELYPLALVKNGYADTSLGLGL